MIEYAFHFIIWTFAVLFSLYNVHQFSKNIHTQKEFSGDFVTGWSVIGRNRDVSDYEWNAWKAFVLSLLPWLIVHFCVGEYLRNKKILLQTWYCVVSLTFSFYKFGSLTVLLFLLQPMIYYLILKVSRKAKSVWTCSCVFLMFVNVLKNFYDDANNYRCIGNASMKNEDSYMMLVTVSWIQLRCISFCLETIKMYPSSHRLSEDSNALKTTYSSLLDMLSYTFYLPFLFLGPVLLFNDFQESFTPMNKSPLQKRLMNFVINATRYLGWFFFTELCLHFIHFNALQFHLEMINMMPDWCLYGGGLWMGVYFYLKYLVVYGLAGSLAAMDHVRPETPPRCIARVHRYSQMWKYFDVGLHKFLIRYIYKPTISRVSYDDIFLLSFMRSFASLICFMFVLFWHGAHHFIFVWTVLNYLGIVMESMGTTFSQGHIYNNFKRYILRTEENNKRFNAFLATPILIVSALSNFYFFAGSEIGDIFVVRVLNQSALSFAVMFGCLYSSCRVSQYLINVHARKIKM